jgi:hypothetical protein
MLAQPVALAPSRLVLLVPVRIARPIRWSQVGPDPVVKEATRLAVHSCCNADYWRVEILQSGVVYWRNEPNHTCALSLVFAIERAERLRESHWYSLRRVPLLWWPRGR